MPELPEVEAVRRSLEQLVVGKTIERVDVRLPRIVRTPSPEVFVQSLTGRRVEAVNRRGKYLLLTVSPFLLISHLRMEGQYRLTETDVDELPHTHVVFQFTDGTELRYRDVRQFGTMDLVRTPSEWPDGLARLGPEPFDPLLTPQLLKSRLASRTVPIKAAWLDQTVLAGVGNIYADEA
ncbi:MAG: DNA-formamidopyrimidine glycosylase, partial [Alicyclobacillaceae bacterium]|nr:DNA-formamidopyrimidine glycosylase [Alicyclobacillaceae bacterium]